MSANLNKKELRLEKLKLLELKKAQKEGLPHIHGFPWYKWAYDYINSDNRMKLICAANQISKSSSQIRHMIDLATDTTKWPKFFPKRDPVTFWYIYPNKTTGTQEFEQKWVKEFLPRNEFKDHPTYGWKHNMKNKEVYSIVFKSGVTLFFKSWGVDLQSGTVDFMGVDEELPKEHYDEINLRLARYEGIFSMVFTATLNQAFWYDAIERIGSPKERFKEAFKRQVSAFDCQRYIDGTKSVWTPEKINKIINSCGSENEVKRRVYGRFISETGLVYESFNKNRNVIERKPVPNNWLWYSGVDIGSGGRNHPAAIVFVAFRPDYKKGRVVRFWKGDNTRITTQDEILQQYLDMKGPLDIVGEYYDYAAKDFHTLAQRSGVGFQKADKSHETGESLLNTMFKNQILNIDDIPEMEDLIWELSNHKYSKTKTHAKDDGIDALRYATSKIPVNLDDIISDSIIKVEGIYKNKNKTLNEQRRESHQHDPFKKQQNDWDFQGDIDEYNDLIEGF